jgi:hypothetical protein
MVYPFLYTSWREVEYVVYPREHVPLNLFPRDPYLYLNASIVDPIIAGEATQYLFYANRFELIAQSGTKVSPAVRTATS